jgi:hypothetical protein
VTSAHNRQNFIEIDLWLEDAGAEGDRFFRELPIGSLIHGPGRSLVGFLDQAGYRSMTNFSGVLL